MTVGTRVRVKSSIMVYHHPQHRNQPLDIKGMEGEIIAVLETWQGRVISPNFPYQVRFAPKFLAHLQPDELDVIEN
ncbi:ferredoxin-thioredoxin reductase variable chain [Candidatus Synechococcus calcipolaris G9]|uniref:Ferredoxin-thioredoxin reductase variable chain n=1 Tax=Candidatus Synechococcus calcipolaris G9 TaxID=1497997 RepID=A0ABT6EWP2_9SYNE|nr:ferredoxin-thioredoxin reductase variable chain [Candidatus Synechococcus calcipolaris]MDG2990178.1 ferredoxin-thioredoxin reductase variable chain [Candidatus Synechococcus calcipolaris G9]